MPRVTLVVADSLGVGAMPDAPAWGDTGADTLGTELMSTAEVAYREGDVGILVLLDAVRTASRARMRDLERRLDVGLAQIALERAVGEVLWP